MTVGTADLNNRSLAILVADDVKEVADLMSDYLSACGHRVTTVISLHDLEQIWSSIHADIVILDISFRDGDGRDLAKRLRIQELSGLIYVTSKSEQNDRVKALDDGADDYITKPINLRELAARVRSVARRRASHHAFKVSPRIPVGELYVNLVNRQVEAKDGRSVLLTAGEFAALVCLASKAGTPCSRDELGEAISAGMSSDPSSRTVDVIVGRLRQKVEVFNEMFPEILTVRNLGYALGPMLSERLPK